MNRPLAIAIKAFLHLLRATLRVRHVGDVVLERTPQYILAFWHAHLALMLFSRFRRPIVVMTSTSKDGKISESVFTRFGVEAVRGSSTRGGTEALRGFIRRAREGKNLVFTPDGPKGPARVAKSGVIYTAQATGLPIVPIAFAAKKKSCCAPGIG
ncbi:MAG TPA: DUF374 domain-containing protein [Thermoanaerobaculia bacterium]|nr:DUF374 domain-containing protein [Thermoanaerobaculia bacterium]